MPLASQSPCPIIVFLWPVIDPILVTFWENVIFMIPTKSISIYFFFLTPKIRKCAIPIRVTLLKMQPHSSQSSRENATPSSGTSPLASYKGVPPSPGISSTNACMWSVFRRLKTFLQNHHHFLRVLYLLFFVWIIRVHVHVVECVAINYLSAKNS